MVGFDLDVGARICRENRPNKYANRHLFLKDQKTERRFFKCWVLLRGFAPENQCCGSGSGLDTLDPEPDPIFFADLIVDP